MDIPYRPLGIIVGVVEQMDLDVTYAYEDLVFIEHNAFLLRMGETGAQVHLYFNAESDVDRRGAVAEQVSALAGKEGLQVIESGTYTMEPREDDQLDIHFHESEAEPASS